MSCSPRASVSVPHAHSYSLSFSPLSLSLLSLVISLSKSLSLDLCVVLSPLSVSITLPVSLPLSIARTLCSRLSHLRRFSLSLSFFALPLSQTTWADLGRKGCAPRTTNCNARATWAAEKAEPVCCNPRDRRRRWLLRQRQRRRWRKRHGGEWRPGSWHGLLRLGEPRTSTWQSFRFLVSMCFGVGGGGRYMPFEAPSCNVDPRGGGGRGASGGGRSCAFLGGHRRPPSEARPAPMQRWTGREG